MKECTWPMLCHDLAFCRFSLDDYLFFLNNFIVCLSQAEHQLKVEVMKVPRSFILAFYAVVWGYLQVQGVLF